MSVEFRLLGDVEVVVDGRPVAVGHARQRSVLAVLLIDVNHVVRVDQLIDRAWDERPPASARATVASYMSRLRQVLADPQVRLVHEPGGYRLIADPMSVDMHRFRRLVAQARAESGAESEVLAYEEALGLWRGEALTGVDSPWLTSMSDALGAERLAVELDRNDVALRRGRHAQLLGELTLRAAAFPWDERVAGQLMLALYRCGRQADALACFRDLQRRLDDDLGTYPGTRLQELHQQILAADDGLDWVPESVVSGVVPRQMPPAVTTFVGRQAELKQLDEIAATATHGSPAVAVAVVSGTAGVGKTTLVVYWASLVADRFPDGQLYVDLHGFDAVGARVSAATAVRGFLAALQVPLARVPDGIAEQAALYRSMMAERRMLVVLDNARDAEQIRPLLPASPGSMVVVTSRHQLLGLIAAGYADLITLDLFEPSEAYGLLAHRLGRDRVQREPEAVRQLIDCCARLPLALSIVAARAIARPEFALASLAAQLRPALDALASDDPATDVRTVFSWSYASLSAPAARLFRLMGLHPGPDITPVVAASLAGVAIEQVRGLIAELARVQLVSEPAPDRFASHDLLRAYAAELAAQCPDAERQTGLQRLFDHYLHTGYQASVALNPSRDPMELAAPQAGVRVEPFASSEEAMAWFIAERAALMGVTAQAQAAGSDRHSQQLPVVLYSFFTLRGLWSEMISAYRIALAAAERRGDRSATAYALCAIARAACRLGDFETAYAHIRGSKQTARDCGDRLGEARACLFHAEIHGRGGRYPEAIAQAQRALSLYRELDHLAGQGRANNRIGWYYAQIGDYRRTIAACRIALTIQRRTGDRLTEVATWDSLGFAHHHLGEHRQAITCFEIALEMSRDLGDVCNEAEALHHLGDAYLALDDRSAARQAWRQSVTIFEALGLPPVGELRAKLCGIDDG